MKKYFNYKTTIDFGKSIVVINADNTQVDYVGYIGHSSWSGQTIKITHLKEIQEGYRVLPCYREDCLSHVFKDYEKGSEMDYQFGLYDFGTHGVSLLEGGIIPEVCSIVDLLRLTDEWESFRKEGGKIPSSSTLLEKAVRRFSRTWLSPKWDGGPTHLTAAEWTGIMSSSHMVLIDNDNGDTEYACLKDSSWVKYDPSSGTISKTDENWYMQMVSGKIIEEEEEVIEIIED